MKDEVLDFALLPLEPTDAMCKAAVWALDRQREKDGKFQEQRPYTAHEKHAIRYRAMIRAYLDEEKENR